MLAGLVLTAHTPAGGGEPAKFQSRFNSPQHRFNYQFKDQAVIEDIFEKIIEI